MAVDLIDARFLTFVGVSALLIAVPGPDMALVTRNALAYGARVARFTAIGVSLGILGWALASAAGVGLVLERSVVAFTVIKLAGAAYLAYLGIRSLLDSRTSGHPPSAAQPAPAPTALTAAAALRQGALGNLLNPKAAVIWVSILPQFVHPGDSWLRLGAMVLVFEIMALLWLTAYGYAISRAGASSAGLRVRRVIERATGVVLIGLGLRLAVERR
jgi:threonine/homoserine/homoserine lactone efflux protein